MRQNTVRDFEMHISIPGESRQSHSLPERFVQKLLITLFTEGDGGDWCPPCLYIKKHLRFDSLFLTHFISSSGLLSRPPGQVLVAPDQTQIRARRSSEELKEVVEVLLVVERETVVGGGERRLEGEQLPAAGAPGLGRRLHRRCRGRCRGLRCC